MPRGIRQLLAEANAQITTLPVATAMELHGAGNVLFVDLRDPRELEREGSIPGAFHCPRGMLEFWLDPDSPYHKPIFSEGRQLIFFCASGWRSALSTKTAQDMGFHDVAHVEGGYTAWRDAGGATQAWRSKS